MIGPGKKYNYDTPTKKKLRKGQQSFGPQDFPAPPKPEVRYDFGPALRELNKGKPLFPKVDHRDKEFIKRAKGTR